MSRHTYWPENTNHAILIKYLKNTRKENLPYRGTSLRKNILLGDLFDDDLYLLCVISIFVTLKLGVISDLKQYRKNLAITFNKFYISICIIKFWINGEMFDSIALTVFVI